MFHAAGLFQRMADTKTRKSVVVAVSCDKLTAAFNCQCCEKGIGDAIASDAGGLAQAGEYFPVPNSRANHSTSADRVAPDKDLPGGLSKKLQGYTPWRT